MQLHALSALSFWLSATATFANAWSTNSTIKITAPQSGATWIKGQNQTITWNATASPDGANMNKDTPELSILKLYTNEKGDTHVILAENFNPTLGSVHVTVPWLDERSDYELMLFVHYKDSTKDFQVVSETFTVMESDGQ